MLEGGLNLYYTAIYTLADRYSAFPNGQKILDMEKTLTIPNFLSVFRILLVPPLLYFLSFNTPHYNWVAFLICLIIIATDYFDGQLARRYGTISNLGKALDPVADKIVVVAAVLYLAFVRGNLPLWFAWLMIGKDLLIILGALIFIAKRTVVQAAVPGKYTLCVVALSLICFLFNLNLLGEWLVLAAAAVVIHSTYFYYEKFLTVLNQATNFWYRVVFPIVFLALITVLGACQQSFYTLNPDQDPNNAVRIIAHRAGAGLAPENTLAAVRKSLELKVDGIEVDLRQAKDSALVVIHDLSVDRTTNGEGRVHDLTLEQIRELDAGSWFGPEYQNEKVPTLSELLFLIDGQCDLYIELKSKKSYPDFSRRVIETLQTHDALAWCKIISFDDALLDSVRAIDPAISVHKLFVGKLPYLPILIDHGLHPATSFSDYRFAQGIALHYSLLSRKIVKDLHALGLAVNIWTVSSTKDMEKLINLGVDGIITDRPDLMIDVLNR